MAGKHLSSSSAGNPRVSTRSPILLFTLSIFALSILFFLFSSIPSQSPPHSNPNPNSNSKPQTNFVLSLELFLTSTKTPGSHTVHDDTVGTITEDDVKKLDDVMWKRETERVYGDPYYPASPLRVYVYDMPKKFTYDLLWLFSNTYKETSNLTSNGSPVHRLIEQHSIDYWLWADLIAPESERLLKNVVRVNRQEDADLFYIPFFTTISFFLLEKQQCKALYRV